MKKLLRIMFSFLLVAALLPQTAVAGTFVPSLNRKAGPLVDWEYSLDGTLILKGRGDMYDTVEEWVSPKDEVYLDFRGDIRKVSMERKDVTLGAITSVSRDAFKDAELLEEAVLSDGLISIGESAFENTPSLLEITFPDTLTTIGRNAFLRSGLTAVTIPQSVTSIGDGAFACTRALGSFKVAEGNTAYKAVGGVLYNAEGTKLVAFPSGKIAQKIRLGSEVKSIGTAFRGANRIGKVILGSGISRLDSKAFADSSLTGIRLPASVTYVGDGAFENCRNMTYVAFMPGTIFGEDVFAGCTGLDTVYYGGTEDEWYAEECADLFDGLDVEVVFETPAPPCNHDEETGWIVDQAAELGVEGFRHKECDDCGETTRSEVIPALTLTAPTVTVKNSAKSDSLVISWKTVKNADSYKVYRATSKSGSYSLKKTTTKLSWEDQSAVAGTKYYYKVKAVYSANSAANSKYSSIVSATCKLYAPTVSGTVVKSTGYPQIQWDEVEGATSYKVYRSTAKDGTYSLKTTSTKFSYTDSSAVIGKTYYYKVTAVCKNSSGTSDKSSSVKLTAKVGVPTISKITYVESSGKPKITWSKVKNAQSYTVYRSSAKDGVYIQLGQTTSLSYTDSGARPGYKYYYKVTANAEKVSSAKSAAKSITCHLARTTLKLTTDSGKPSLKWSKVINADQYKIYRATSKDGKYSLVKTTTGTTWKNTSAKKGTTYYYKIKAVYSDNTTANSAYSAVKSIKCTK